MTAGPTIDNRLARRLHLAGQSLLAAPASGRTLDAAASIVDALGMVQLDPIRTVARAHEHILWSRSSGCGTSTFERLIRDRRVFEHFSHDAAILPMHYWPVWQRQRDRRAERFASGLWGRALPKAAARREILERIAAEGPLSSRDFEGRADKRLHAWMKPPHKLALDWLWLAGDLAVADRRGFVKRYDLTERIVPDTLRDARLDNDAALDRLHRDALARLGVASAGELQRFWDATDASETRAWIADNAETLVNVEIVAHDGRRHRAIAPADIESRLASLPPPSTRLRIVNPFDPVVRDRRRLARLFGFDYTIEIYVPPAKRRYGYYVYPLLEGDRFVGRADLRVDRERGALRLAALWPEPGVNFGRGRRERLLRELARFAALARLHEVDACLPA